MSKIQSPEEEEKQVDPASFQKRIELTFWKDLAKAKNQKIDFSSYCP